MIFNCGRCSSTWEQGWPLHRMFCRQTDSSPPFNNIPPLWSRPWMDCHGSRLPRTHHGLLELVGFDAAHKEGLAHAECPHQQLQGAFELAAECRRALPRLYALRSHNRDDLRRRGSWGGEGWGFRPACLQHWLLFPPLLSFSFPWISLSFLVFSFSHFQLFPLSDPVPPILPFIFSILLSYLLHIQELNNGC